MKKTLFFLSLLLVIIIYLNKISAITSPAFILEPDSATKTTIIWNKQGFKIVTKKIAPIGRIIL